MKFRFFRQAAKIDYLESQPGFAQTPEGRAGIHMLRTRYPESGDKAFPLLFREYKRGMETGGQQGIVIPPSYLGHHRHMEAYKDRDPQMAEHHRAILDGDRPDAYFWKMKPTADGPQYDPVQPGMVQNLGRMFKWMKGANQPLPNMDSKATTLESVEQLYNDWKAKYDRDRDPHLGSIAHTYPDGWTMRTCDNPAQCYDEGEEMNHCGAKYAPLVQAKSHTLYSLRDPQNWPHASFVYRPGEHTIEDIRGKSNQGVSPNYLSYLTDYFSQMGDGLTISGHPDPHAPPIPDVEQYGLPVVGDEAQRQANRIARRLGYDPQPKMEHEAGWIIEADKLNDYLRGKIYRKQPCPTCGGRRFVEDANGKRGPCPECKGKGEVPVMGENGEPALEKYMRPEFADPEHPDYPANSAFLGALEKQFHSEDNDQLFPFLADQFRKGRLRMQPTDGEQVFDPDEGRYVRRAGDPRFEYANDPEDVSDSVQEWAERMREQGYDETRIRDMANRMTPHHWENRGVLNDWNTLDRSKLDEYGKWLSEATSQNPSRHPLEVWDASANQGEGSFVPHPKYNRPLDLNNSSFNELDARKKAYDEWLHAKTSLDRAIFKSNDKKYHIVPLSSEECPREGNTMHNCIGSYGDKVARGDALLYSLRDKNGKPHADIEIGPQSFFNKQSGESLPAEEYKRLKAQADGQWVNCPDCEGHGRPVYRDDEGNVERDRYGDIRINYDVGYCPTCNGNGSVRSEADPALKERVQGFEPSPFDGKVVQIQGKQNSPPLPHFQRPIKEFFGKFPQDRLPTWQLSRNQFSDFRQTYADDGHMIMYHPGDYGLPDPGITTDWPSYVRSYMNSGGSDDRQNRRRANFLVNTWGRGHGQLEHVRQTLGDPQLMEELKARAAGHFDPHDTDEMRAWNEQNPNPRQNLNNPQPNWFDPQGNYRDETPEFQGEMADWERREQEAWRAEEAWQNQRDAIAQQVREQHAGDAYKQLPEYKMWDYANTLANGGELAVPAVDEDRNIVASIRSNTPEWCICGRCQPEWNFARVANEQIWNKVRNMLRKNNIATDENLAAWEHLKNTYPDASPLGEFLHREFRKGRLRMPLSPLATQIEEYEKRAQRYEENAEQSPYDRAYYQQRAEAARNQAEQLRAQLEQEGFDPNGKPFTVPNFQAEEHPNGELTPELMQHFMEEVKKQGQREKGWNIMKQEMAPLTQTAYQAEQAAWATKHAGDTLYESPAGGPYAGWTMRYLNTPQSAANEKKLMGHCVDKYGDRILCGATHNLSVRDAEGKGHRTLELFKDQLPDAGMHDVNDVTNSVLDWDKIRGAMGGDWDVDKHQKAVEDFLSRRVAQSGAGPKAWDRFAHDEADETREFLAQARERGAINSPKAFPGNWRVYQNIGRSGSMGSENTTGFIREWMNSLPWEQRPLGQNRGSRTAMNPHDFIDRVEEEGQPVDEYGFRLGSSPGAQRVNWQNVANGLVKEPRYDRYGDDLLRGQKPVYDPEVGQRTYEWARDNNQLSNFYNQVAAWEKPSRNRNRPPANNSPSCPNCQTNRYVEPRDGNNWYCGWCGRSFENDLNGLQPRNYVRQGPQYNDYQQAAVQHLAPLFGQHPELVAAATAPACPACGRSEYVEARDGGFYCAYCGHEWQQQQASVKVASESEPIPHIDSGGNLCHCRWYDGPPMNDFEVIANAVDSDWGEDSDSGLGEPDPSWDWKPKVDGHVVPCPVCQDPMEDGECRRCDWGDWGRSQPTPNPHDPFRDLKSPVQSAWVF